MPPASSHRNAAHRLLKELDAWAAEPHDPTDGIERLGPVHDGELLTWQAVINGRGVGAGYENGRWLLDIEIPPTYPLAPPTVRFATPVVHANVALTTGEVCLDLLRGGAGGAWTPAYTVAQCVRAVRALLACPAPDSPLNVDVAALLRAGDAVAARRLVEFWIEDDGGRYDGD